MLKIRLARGGAKKRPYYHIVVADSHAPRDGKFIEKVGSYNPMLPKDGAQPRVALKVERIAEWLGKGAQPTDRVARFLSQDETLGAKGNNPNKGAPGKKAQERAAERAQREADRLEAEAAAKAEAAEAAARAKEEAEAAKNAPAAEEAPAAEAAAEEAPAAEETTEA
ncbi:hypothetical protein LTR94_021829 [Friedmanniomyces endolithicus]|nr:hypothetical protein LTR94_021829 [Friedmanniomyces endolithicus]